MLNFRKDISVFEIKPFGINEKNLQQCLGHGFFESLFRPKFIEKMDRRMTKLKKRALKKSGCPVDEDEDLANILNLITSLYKF